MRLLQRKANMPAWTAVLATAFLLGHAYPLRSHAQSTTRYKPADLTALQNAFTKLAQDVRPSVVAIQTYRRSTGERHGRVRAPVSRGSGFIIDRDGYICTNRHVLEEANEFTVILDNGQRYDGTVIQIDPRSDLAVMKIDAEGLTPIRWGRLRDVQVNQWTFAIGNPFGLANRAGRMSVTYGAVSALGRDMTTQLVGRSLIQYYGNLIETTSAINPGNSGGPLFNLDGEVIGVVTAIETGSGAHEGVGFAIPIDANTLRIIDSLTRGEVVRYGFLGIEVTDVDAPRSRRVADSRVYRGALIAAIEPVDGPAARAGLLPGDVVIEYEGVPVENSDHLVRMVSFSPVNAEVSLTYLRKNVKRKSTVKLADRHDLLGFNVND